MWSKFAMSNFDTTHSITMKAAHLSLHNLLPQFYLPILQQLIDGVILQIKCAMSSSKILTSPFHVLHSQSVWNQHLLNWILLISGHKTMPENPSDKLSSPHKKTSVSLPHPASLIIHCSFDFARVLPWRSVKCRPSNSTLFSDCVCVL